MATKVLVTGAEGFIGSHLVEALVHEGQDVRCFCMYNSFGDWGWLDSLPSSIKNSLDVVLGDIRDPYFVREAMMGCDHVYHLAALIAIPYSYQAPSSYIDTNIHGTLNVVQAARDLGVSRVIHTSTSETYGSAQYVPIDELHPLVGQSPYSASKIGADQIALSYYRSFNTPITVIRPFNTYGPRQSSRAVIPTIITQILSGNHTIKLGSLRPTRDFSYVEDTCSAFIKLMSCPESVGKVVNSASGFEISIGDAARMIAHIMESNIKIVSDEVRIRPEHSEVDRLYGDNTLLTRLTGWTPRWGGLAGFREGLELTIEWFRLNQSLTSKRSGSYSI